jgi:hypothetical protein
MSRMAWLHDGKGWSRLRPRVLRLHRLPSVPRALALAAERGNAASRSVTWGARRPHRPPPDRHQAIADGRPLATSRYLGWLMGRLYEHHMARLALLGPRAGVQ